MKPSKVNQNPYRRLSDQPSKQHGKRIPVAMSPNIVQGVSVTDILREATLQGGFHRDFTSESSESPYKAALSGNRHLGNPRQPGYTGGDTGVSPAFPLRESSLADPYPARAFAAPKGAQFGLSKVLTARTNHRVGATRATPASSEPQVAQDRGRRPAGM